MSERLNELRLRGHNSCITMECVWTHTLVQSPLTHTHTHAYTPTVLSTTILFSPPPQSVLACVQVFLATGALLEWSVFPMRCVRAASC